MSFHGLVIFWGFVVVAFCLLVYYSLECEVSPSPPPMLHLRLTLCFLQLYHDTLRCGCYTPCSGVGVFLTFASFEKFTAIISLNIEFTETVLEL